MTPKRLTPEEIKDIQRAYKARLKHPEYRNDNDLIDELLAHALATVEPPPPPPDAEIEKLSQIQYEIVGEICNKCDNDLAACVCPDLKERFESIMESRSFYIGPAYAALIREQAERNKVEQIKTE